jgi:hypothetical protein
MEAIGGGPSLIFSGLSPQKPSQMPSFQAKPSQEITSLTLNILYLCRLVLAPCLTPCLLFARSLVLQNSSPCSLSWVDAA